MKQIKEFLKNRKEPFKELNNEDIFLINHKIILTYNNDTIYNFKKIILNKNKRDYSWIKTISNIINYSYQSLFDSFNKKYSEKDFFNFSIASLKKSQYKLFNSNSLTGGYSLINHFHKSLLLCSRGTKKSPLESINNSKDFFYTFNNRVIYDKKEISNDVLINGLTISQRAPRVSIFSPSLAKHILKTYASDANTVLDPFSGFSGRMLGTLALNKIYIGSDLRSNVIDESKEILKFLNLNCDLTVSDFKDRSNIEADVLFTCPPYSTKEFWPGVNKYYTEDYYIDYILKNFKCKKYIFVVKDTKYINNIVTTFRNGSWIKSKSNEKLLIF